MSYVVAAAVLTTVLVAVVVFAPVLMPLLRGETPTLADYGRMLLPLALMSLLYGAWKNRVREGLAIGVVFAGAGVLLSVAGSPVR